MLRSSRVSLFQKVSAFKKKILNSPVPYANNLTSMLPNFSTEQQANKYLLTVQSQNIYRKSVFSVPQNSLNNNFNNNVRQKIESYNSYFWDGQRSIKISSSRIIPQILSCTNCSLSIWFIDMIWSSGCHFWNQNSEFWFIFFPNSENSHIFKGETTPKERSINNSKILLFYILKLIFVSIGFNT